VTRGDGIETSQCIDDGADAANGISATTAGADAGQISSAASVISDFKKAFTGANDYGAYTMSAYDAANIEIAAIKKAIDAGKDPKKVNDFREAVRANVASTSNYQGVLVAWRLGDDLAARIAKVTLAIEFADVPGQLVAHAIDRADEVAVGDGMRGLFQLPKVLGKSGDSS